MDLYAQPIPPEMAIQPSSRVNLKEALMQRLSQVQLQKQRESGPKSSDFEALEKGLLIEMLEKAQKMQAAAQASWSKEKEELLSQVRRLSSQSRRPSGDFRRDPLPATASRRPQSDTISPAKADKDDRPKTSQEPSKTEKVLKLQLTAMEKRLSDLENALETSKKALETAEKSLEEEKFLMDERTAYIESLEEQLGTGKNTGEAKAVQTEDSEEEGLKRTIAVMEEQMGDLRGDLEEERGKSRKMGAEIEGLKDVIADQKAIITLVKASKPTNTGIRELQDVPFAVDSFLAGFEEQNQRVIEVKLELSGLGKMISALQAQFTAFSSVSEANQQSEDGNLLKGMLAGAVLCVRTLRDVIEDLTRGSLPQEQGMLEALRAEVELLRKEKGIITEQLIKVTNRDVSQLQAQLTPISLYITSVLPSIESIQSLRQAELDLLPGLKACIDRLLAVPAAGSHVCNHTEQIEAMSGSLKTIQVDFSEYKQKVAQDKAKFSEQLFKIAESLEYRKDLWEQLQTLEADENQLERLSSLSEELERQTEWETENLALLISWMRERETTEKEEKPRRSIATIPEEEEEEEDETV